MWVCITLVSITRAVLEARIKSIKDEECSVTLVGNVIGCLKFNIQKLKFNRNIKCSNLSTEEWAALKNLNKRKDIVIKPADKGGAVVVWRSDLYQQEAFRQLSDKSFYAKVDKDLTLTNQKLVKETIQDLISKQELPATAQNLIITTPRTSRIHFKPKIHKPNNPGRPIVSACSCPTELISSYLDKIMVPIVKSLPSHIKDTNHALKIFRDFTFSGKNKFIFTMDITSLYTVIPNNEGLSALKILLRPALYKRAQFRNITTPSRISFDTKLFLFFQQPLPTNQWCRHGH